jgi:hypothetical protein
MKKMRHSLCKAIVILFTFCFLIPNIATAKVYKWKDDSGKTHYTDSPNKIPQKYRNKNKTDTIGTPSAPVASIKKTSSKKSSGKKSSSFKIPTTGFGKLIGKRHKGTSFSYGCSNVNVIEERKRRAFLNFTQHGCSMKEENSIRRPVGDIDCKEIKEGNSNCSNKKVWVKCSIDYQCVRETPEYNQAKYKKILESFEAEE